jgi:hypothetical protein
MCEPSGGGLRGDVTLVAIASTRIEPNFIYAVIPATVTIVNFILFVITGPVAVAIPHPVRFTAFHDQRQ